MFEAGGVLDQGHESLMHGVLGVLLVIKYSVGGAIHTVAVVQIDTLKGEFVLAGFELYRINEYVKEHLGWSPFLFWALYYINV